MNRKQRRAAKKQPAAQEQLEALIALALERHSAGKLGEAEEAYRAILEAAPGWAEAHSNLGAALEGQGRLGEAEACYRQALALKAGAVMHYNLGNVLKAQGKLEEAAAQYKQALALKSDYAGAHNNLGIVFKLQERLEEAVAHYTRALEIKPGFAEAHNNLGNVCKELGKLREAEEHYQLALELKPDYAEAHYNYAELHTFRPGDARLAELEALANDSLPESGQMHMHFALAKALGDTGDTARAFDHLLKGNALKRKSLKYDEAGIQSAVRDICRGYTPELFGRFEGAGNPSQVPVFIVGMPRSGTTLIEQILASHGQVYGAGELDVLPRIAQKIVGPYAARIAALDAGDVRRLGDAYLAQLPPLPPGKTRLTDKRPLNFFYVGLIRLILPHAKIIHAVRGAEATCFSCFTKLFASNLGFAYDLAELGRYWRYYNTLMGHWRSVSPPGAMLEVRYEDLVNDAEPHVRGMLDYCGLEWDERCLRFYETQRPVATASTLQVRKPLYRSSLDHWRQYEAYLTPLLAALGA